MKKYLILFIFAFALTMNLNAAEVDNEIADKHETIMLPIEESNLDIESYKKLVKAMQTEYFKKTILRKFQ